MLHIHNKWQTKCQHDVTIMAWLTPRITLLSSLSNYSGILMSVILRIIIQFAPPPASIWNHYGFSLTAHKQLTMTTAQSLKYFWRIKYFSIVCSEWWRDVLSSGGCVTGLLPGRVIVTNGKILQLRDRSWEKSRWITVFFPVCAKIHHFGV